MSDGLCWSNGRVETKLCYKAGGGYGLLEYLGYPSSFPLEASPFCRLFTSHFAIQ